MADSTQLLKDCFANGSDLPPGVHRFSDTIRIAKCGGHNRGKGAAYALPTNALSAAGNGGANNTILIDDCPATIPGIVIAGHQTYLDGFQLQRGDFRRDPNRIPIPPARDGHVGITYERAAAPGGPHTLGTVSFVGYEVPIKIASECNNIVGLNLDFMHCWNIIRSEHDQNFGLHIVHATVSGYCDTILDYQRGGRFQVDYLYTNSPALVCRMGNLGSGRSRGVISNLNCDENAKGFRLLEVNGPGSIQFIAAGHIPRGAIPAADWVKFNGVWTPGAYYVDVRTDFWSSQKLPGVRLP